MTTIRLKGGRVYDPANGVDGQVRDIGIRDGRIVALHPEDKVDAEYDLAGCVVMAGGIDLHTHIGGGKVNLARMMLPEDHRLNRPRDSLLELASNGSAPRARSRPATATRRWATPPPSSRRCWPPTRARRTWRWATRRSSTTAPT